jgi:hypothetical protein
MMAVPAAMTMTAAVRVVPAATVAHHLDERHQTNRSENEPEHRYLLGAATSAARKKEIAQRPLRTRVASREEM